MNQDYRDYLLSPEWKAFRKKVFKHQGKKCSKCHRTKRLHIHHLTYANIFHEELSDVIVLCFKHHEEAHGIKKSPTLAQKALRKKRKTRKRGLMADHKRFAKLHRKQFKLKK